MMVAAPLRLVARDARLLASMPRDDRDESGTWRQLLDGVGVPTALATKQQGWPDIEVGGPGFGKFPVHRWNGKAYVGPK